MPAGRAVGGLHRVVVPEVALPEAALVDGIDVFGAGTLDEMLRWLNGTGRLRRPGQSARVLPEQAPPDLADVLGQDDACHGSAIPGKDSQVNNI